MNPTLQNGSHPDVESLNAFVEQALKPAEREHILAHMATCGRCREVVYLAQEMAGGDAAEANPAAASGEPVQDSPIQIRRGWMAGWRLIWIPAFALAGVVGVAILQHARQNRAERQIAGNSVQEQLPKSVPSERQEVAKPTSSSPSEAKKADKTTSESSGAPVEAKPSRRDAGVATQIDESSARSREVAPAVASPSGGSVAGLMKSEPSMAQRPAVGGGGPHVSDQLSQQQQVTQQQKPLEKELQATRYAEDANVNALTTASRAEVDSAVQAEMSPAANAPAPLAHLALKSSASSNEVAAGKVAADLKAKSIRLPNGKTALSVATVRQQMLAIDPMGEMYLSDDAGKQWVLVARQWTGRAVLVRARQPVAERKDGLVLHGEATTGSQGPTFELVNNNLQTWVSSDGKNWLPQTLAPK